MFKRARIRHRRDTRNRWQRLQRARASARGAGDWIAAARRHFGDLERCDPSDAELLALIEDLCREFLCPPPWKVH